MVRRIFDQDNTNFSPSMIDLQLQGFRRFEVPQDEQQDVEHGGRMWRRELRLVRTLSCGECFVMFFTALFKKMQLALGSITNPTQIENMREEWDAVFSGRMVTFVYRPVVNSSENVQQMAAQINRYNLPFGSLAASNVNLQQNTDSFAPWDAPRTNLVPEVVPLTAAEEELQAQVQAATERYRSLMGAVLTKLRQWLEPVNNLVRPVLVPLERGYAIQIPTATHLNRFSQPLCQRLVDKLQQAGIPFEHVSIQNGAKAEYRLDIAHMPTFLAALPQLELDDNGHHENAAREEFISYGNATFVQHASSTVREDIEKAIALSLAHTSPALRPILAQVAEGASVSHLVPHISIDFSGMTIRIPEGQDLLKSLLEAVHGLHVQLEDSIIDSRAYAYKAHIPRDEIKALFDKIGLQALPGGEGATYFSALVNAGHIHAYAPVLEANPYATLNQSLSKLVPNVHLHPETLQEEPLVPYTAMHPRGWLCIRLPKLAEIGVGQTVPDDHFAKGLQQYLGLAEPYAIDFTAQGITYDREHRIDPRDLPAFLKKIDLEKDLEGQPFIDKLALPEGVRPYEGALSSPSLSFVIKQRLEALLPVSERHGLEHEQIEFRMRDERVELFISTALYETEFEIYRGERMSFGEYLAHAFGLNRLGRQSSYSWLFGSSSYCLSLPASAMRSFLEKDLGLRSLPLYSQTESLRTYYDVFVYDRRGFGLVRPAAYLDIVGWHLRNPTPPLPQNIPQLSTAEIVQQAGALLEGHPSKDQYCHVIRQTLERARQLAPGTARMMFKYLTMMVVPIEGLQLAREQCRVALINIGETATACTAGRFTKVEQEFRYLVSPEARDQVKSLLLTKVELFKDGVLAEIFNGAPSCMHVHCVAAAKLRWGHELGLDVAAGSRDENNHYGIEYVNSSKKRQFKDICQRHLVSHLLDELAQDHDEDTGQLLHADLYRERLVRILQARGYLLQEIEGQDEHPLSGRSCGGQLDIFMPLDAQGQPTLAREGLEALLIDIGVLQG